MQVCEECGKLMVRQIGEDEHGDRLYWHECQHCGEIKWDDDEKEINE